MSRVVMNFNSKTILILLVVFLLGTNITMIVSYRNHLKNESVEPTKPAITVPDRQLGKFFNTELNLSADQQNQFRNARRQYNRQANFVLNEMQLIRNRMGKALDSTNPDRPEFERLAQELAQKHVALKDITFDYYIQLQSFLDADQQEKMKAIFQAMLNEEGNVNIRGNMRGGPGNGQGKGRGQGPGNR